MYTTSIQQHEESIRQCREGNSGGDASEVVMVMQVKFMLPSIGFRCMIPSQSETRNEAKSSFHLIKTGDRKSVV